MAQGVEVDVVELGRRDGVVVGSLDIAGLEDPTVSLRAEADKGPVRVVVHRNFAAPPALGELQPDDAAAEVDALPREPQQLAATEAGVQATITAARSSLFLDLAAASRSRVISQRSRPCGSFSSRMRGTLSMASHSSCASLSR